MNNNGNLSNSKFFNFSEKCLESSACCGGYLGVKRTLTIVSGTLFIKKSEAEAELGGLARAIPAPKFQNSPLDKWKFKTIFSNACPSHKIFFFFFSQWPPQGLYPGFRSCFEDLSRKIWTLPAIGRRPLCTAPSFHAPRAMHG